MKYLALGLLTSSLFFAPAAAFGAQVLPLLGSGYASPDWQVVSEKPLSVSDEGEVVLLKMDKGVTYLVHPYDPQQKYGRLTLEFSSTAAGKLEIIAGASTTGDYSYEYQADIAAGQDPHRFVFFLHHPYYRDIQDFALKFTMESAADIRMSEIALSRDKLWQTFGAAVTDYFRTAPYSGFTVNVFPTPMIFGHAAFYFFLPLLALFLAGIFFQKWRKAGLVGLLVLWLVTDFRMDYEFAKYELKDYQTWIKPAAAEKTLRTYEDFYVFAKWLSQNLPAEQKEIVFYGSHEHYPRLLQYYLYPVRVMPKEEDAKISAVFHRQDIKDKLISEGAAETAFFDQDSGIFVIPTLSPPFQGGDEEGVENR